MTKYKDSFRAELPEAIEVIGIEEELTKYFSIIMKKPDLANLNLTVAYIIQETIGFRNTLPIRQLAFMKDLWSLYCVWAYGGYHIDCGCYPDPDMDADYTLPDPTTFGAVALGGRADYYHGSLQLQPQEHPVCACLSSGNILYAALKDLYTPIKTMPRMQTERYDVWLLRSPQHDGAARRALEFYVQGWFALRDLLATLDRDSALYGDHFRELVVSSVATGINHGDSATTSKSKRSSCGGRLVPSACNIETLGGMGGTNRLKDLHIRKVGFQSHRG